MAEEIVTLGIEVKTDGVKQGAESLDKLAQAGARAEKSTTAMSDSAAKANAQIAAMAQKAQGAGNAFKPLDPAADSMSKIAREAKTASESVKQLSNSARQASANLGDAFSKLKIRDSASIVADARSIREALNSIKASGTASEIARATASAKSQIAGLRNEFDGIKGASESSSMAVKAGWLAAGAAIVSFASYAIQAADAYTLIDSRLKLVTGSSEEAAAVQAKLFKIAQDTRQSFPGIAQTYSQIARSASEMGISQDRLIAVSKTLSQAISVSGGSASSANAAMIQLSQGMASGTLRGEELNSVMEQTPRVAQAIAQGLGVSIGELRKMGQEGELTAQKVIGALEKSAKSVNDEFARMTPTIESGFTKLSNSTGNFIDKLNDATGASKGLFNVLSGISGLMDGAASWVERGFNVARMNVVAQTVTRLENQLKGMDQRDPRRAGVEQQLFTARGASMAGGAEQPILPPGTPKENGPSSDYLKLTQKMSGVSQDFYKNLKVLNDEYGRTGNLKNYQAEVKKLIETETQIGRDSVKKPRSGGGGGKSSSISDEAKEYAAAMKSLADIARDADKSTLDLSGSQQKLYDLMTSANWAKMPDAWKQTALAQFEAARAAELNAKFLKDVEAQSVKNVAANQAMFDQTQTLQKQAELYGMTASQISVMEEARLEDAIALATQNGAYPEHIAFLEQELAARKKLNAAYEENDLKRLLSGTKSQENKRKEADRATLDRGLASGKITKDEYDEAIAKFKESTDEMSEFSKQAARNMQDAMAEFFINPTKDGIEGMADSFGKTVQKMIAQAASAQLMNLLFGDMGKTGKLGTDSLVGAGLSALTTAFGFHEGGIVGSGDHSFTRTVPASLFNNAPRYHSGGIVGDEVPAILKKGERVLTKEQQQGMGNVVININSSNGDPAEIRRAAAAGARTALGAMNGARRYG